MSIVESHALFVVQVEQAVDGYLLTAVRLPVAVEQSYDESNRFFLSSGDVIEIESAQSESKIGDLRRVREESLGQSIYHSTSSDFGETPAVRFWLFPAPNMHVNCCKCHLATEGFSFFKSAGLQMASWSRFMWGNTFFDDPNTPKEHIAKACEGTFKVGDVMPVFVKDTISGVLVIEKNIDTDEFETNIFTIHRCEFVVGDCLDSYGEMSIEGVSANFRSRIGSIKKVIGAVLSDGDLAC